MNSNAPLEDHPLDALREPSALEGWILEVLDCDPKGSRACGLLSLALEVFLLHSFGGGAYIAGVRVSIKVSPTLCAWFHRFPNTLEDRHL